MIKSMTGFGRGKHEGEAFACTVEVKSVNHRFLDPHLKLPSEFASVELKLKRLIQSRIKRGRLDLFLNIERSQTVDFTFNEPVLQAYVKAIEKLKRAFSLSGELDLVQLIRVPGIMNLEVMSLSPEGRQQIPNALDAYQERLKIRLNELLRGTPVDPNRLVQEAAFYVERSDISEEVTRLQSHVVQCEVLLNSGEEAGKTLDFLLQEMNREANTVLSKTTGLTGNGLEIANAAIVIKTEVEKIREQAQNIE